MNRALPSIMALWLLGVGCTKKEAPQEAATTATATSSPRTAALVGIAECDDYLQKYEACLRRTRATTSLQGLASQREGFRLAAATPEGKAGLQATCKSLLDQLATVKACADAP
jgi:hypothetical protein